MSLRLVRAAAVARRSYVGPSSLFLPPSTTSRNSHRPHRTLSSNILLRHCATSSNAELEETKNRRISRKLYRDLLRWCQQTGQAEQYPDSILECMEIPPVTFWAVDDVDDDRMELLLHRMHPSVESGNKRLEMIVRLLPPKCDVGSRKLVAPVLSFSGLRGLVRAIFHLNHVALRTKLQRKENGNGKNYDTERQTTAFQALQSLNELTVKLSAKAHPRRVDRHGVAFRLGQVVQHLEKRWRGVVIE
jgi:hypothetical protein